MVSIPLQETGLVGPSLFPVCLIPSLLGSILRFMLKARVLAIFPNAFDRARAVAIFYVQRSVLVVILTP